VGLKNNSVNFFIHWYHIIRFHRNKNFVLRILKDRYIENSSDHVISNIELCFNKIKGQYKIVPKAFRESYSKKDNAILYITIEQLVHLGYIDKTNRGYSLTNKGIDYVGCVNSFV